jgi:hypothetical protein
LALKDLQQDDHPMAVEVYIRLLRGVEILPPELAAQIKPSRVPNYKPKTPLLARQRGPELQRHFDRGFVAYWDDVKKCHPDIGDPHNIHAFGIQPKNEEVCRLTLDATNNGSADYPSVNEIIEKYKRRVRGFVLPRGGRDAAKWRYNFAAEGREGDVADCGVAKEQRNKHAMLDI